MNDYFKRKTVLITGASRGIGKKITDSFMQCGANVIAPGRDEMDLADPDSVESYLNRHRDDKIDIMVFCAGINHKALIENLAFDKLYETFQVNLFSTVQIIKQYIGGMKKRKDGKIILISSLYASVSREERAAYGASKNAMTGLMKTLALEGAEEGICVNAVAPGYVLTEMTRKNLSGEELEKIKEQIPMHRLQEPGEIADLVLFLAGDWNKSITGQLISVDGGFLCR